MSVKGVRPLFLKVCGITRLVDADLAAEAGASAIGFIFWPGSPRYITPAGALEIVRHKSPHVEAVGVFVDETLARVRNIAEIVGLDAVQLHGSESAEYCRQMAGVRRVIKSVALRSDAPADVSAFDDDVLILLDAHDPVRRGGTGRTIDWDAARGIAASRRTILSGGLNADNIGRAIAAVKPYGVDVSSGVEAAPGVKDATRLKAFFEAMND
jgi:phosphoribosylanthranilate isomerase